MLATIALAVLATGCGDDDIGAMDGGGADAGTDEGVPSPALPSAPELGTCPPEWMDAGECVPEPPSCEPDERGTPTGCHTFSPCPEDLFPTLAGDFIHVVPGGATGTGSRESPHGSLTAALRDAEPGDTVLLAKGEHLGGQLVPNGVTIRGACAAETTVRGDAISGYGMASIADATALSHLTIDANGGAGVVTAMTGALSLEEVVITNATGAALSAEGASTVALDRSRIRGVAVSPSGFATAINAVDQAQVTVRESDIGEAAVAGVVVGGEAMVLLEESWLHDTLGEAAQTAGVIVARGGTFEARGSFLSGHASRVFNVGGESRVTVVDSSIVGHGDAALGDAYAGVVNAGGGLDLTRTRIRNVVGAAFVAQGELLLTDVAIDTVEARPESGTAIVAAGGAWVELTRVAVRDTAAIAVNVAGLGTMLHAQDLSVARVALVDGTAVALAMSDGAAVQLERVELAEGSVVQLFVGANSTLDGHDLTIRDSQRLPQQIGWGLFVDVGARATLERVAVERPVDSALVAQGIDAYLEVDGLRVDDVRERDCAMPCDDGVGGFGIGAYEGGEVVARRFLLRDTPFCAVHIGPEGSVSLAQGRIERASIGACVHTTSVGIEELTDEVTFVDTDVSIDTVSIPIPEPPTL